MTQWIHRSETDGVVIFMLSGRIQMEHLLELNDQFEVEGADQRIMLDLKKVKLIDREAVGYLARCEVGGTSLDSCPAFIRESISKERNTQSVDEKET